MDVKSAFLYETIEEEVYVCQPPGFEDPDYLDKVYKVVKALYGLHQAPRAWYKTLPNYLLENGFQRAKIDHTLFIQKQKVKSIFRYLKGKPHLGLWYPKDSPFNLVAYSDSNYDGVILDGKSTTGGYQFLGCRLISWQCKKHTVATSSTEVEYVAAASCCAQVLWIQNQLLDYRLIITVVSYTLMLFGLRCCSLNAARSQCMSSKRTAWNEFSTSMASVVICLARGIRDCQAQAESREVREEEENQAFWFKQFMKGGKITELDADEDVTIVDVDTIVEIDVDTQGRMEENFTAIKELNVAEPIVFDDE
nr:ribonuclease H-like domain, reverse transcriptase, RNA-dependent DNA polymerase [Tanacetum cinerariifolium]